MGLMAPGEMRSPSRTVAAFFGDDADRPLWFKKDVFMGRDFDCDAYITNLRSFVPLDTLRGELRTHFSALKNELVELINRDYNDFVNLSTKLVDVDGAVLRMRTPLQELRTKLISMRDGVDGSLFSLQDALKRRAEASASREILELLLDTSHVVSKIEKLLQELKNMPQDGTHFHENHSSSITTSDGIGVDLAENGASPEESRSRLLERIASEMNRLKFYVARVQDLPFIRNMEKRIQNADVSLGDSLRRCFELGLERRDKRVLYHCLRAYAAIDDTAGAEDAFQRTIVAPFVQRIIPPSVTKDLVGGAGDRLEEHFREIETHIEADCRFLLDIVASENSGLHVFDFLGNSILKEVHSAIQKGKPGALSPGKPADFLENYKSSLKFLTFVEGFCQSQSAVVALRSRAAYTDFIKLWNLGVYFTLRFQEIASSLDSILTEGLRRTQEDGFAFQNSAKLWECLERCWYDDVYTSALSDRFLRLSLQLISRYVTWLSSGLAARRAGNTGTTTWSLSASPEDFLLLRHDVELLHQRIIGSYMDHVLELLAPISQKILTSLKQSIVQAGQALLDVVPVLADVLTDTLTEKCLEDLKALKGITTTYRMTNKPLPTRHSYYASNILQSLKTFLEGDHNMYMTEASRSEILTSVAIKVTKHYDEQIRELVAGARKTESYLLRIRQARQRTGAGTDTHDLNVSDTDKVYAQLSLDVQEYGRRLDALGVSAKDLPAFQSLWQFVAPQDRQQQQ